MTEPTSKDALDASVARLNEAKDAWARLPVGERIPYFERLRKKTARHAEEWVRAAVDAKRIPEGSPLAGEEWLSGPYAMLHGLNRMIATLEAIRSGRYPRLGAGSVRTRPDGQVIVDVYPGSLCDRLLTSGIRAEVWMEPGVTPENLTDHMGSFYRSPQARGKVALVLGAGNIASIGPLDVLYRMFAMGQVCLLKMNPVNDYLGNIFENVFADFVEAGWVRLAYGGADVGAYLVSHPGIDEIHITGSGKTHDAIVFGSGIEGEQRKAANRPATDKPVTSELGNVSPTIVLPGPWSAPDFEFQAEHLATQKFHNGGFNCIACQVLVLPRDWSGSAKLMGALQDVIRRTEMRHPYYPAAEQRQGRAAGHPQAARLDSEPGGRTLITDLDPDEVDSLFDEEVFAAVLAQTSLPSDDPVAYLQRAVAFCNERLHGTLGVNIIAHPATIKTLGSHLSEAIAGLRYGTVGLNLWQGAGYLLQDTPWGAFPGHTYQDIQSGIGKVHNTHLFDAAQKAVVYGPFFPFPRALLHGERHLLPKPPWFVTHRNAHRVARRMVAFEADAGLWRLPGIFWYALRS
ncbi:MAG: aldehyde dehydrogenase family protein [Acidobacteria bacterium]|nr:aldehyde dehydrogenase family protein [Acidobacteriota bacterium]NIM60958.1 aldehyde dehydrogenase family protein [Acidobacteriota bacterium]NIO60448.1 aldehyde dehydrogenase family protein [Acidobacteriota bacterium]NIQ31546.1 aldehyde dehydrogenase family protein [Acidobacteriota bacterium]NIQ86798.1 aldehyde dehydrogenase family protein [Acidobacteriota bacterium]